MQNGYLLLADLSGYTKFMASSELEHAKEILSDLINLVIKNLKPVFTIAEIEGDAVFAYAPDNSFSRGETLLELIEQTYYYFTFQKKVMLDRTTCTCKACNSVSSLDLKFISHYGNFALQNYSGAIKPLGSEVNLIHRLLKNSVIEKTGIASYSIFTEQCINKLNISNENFIPHSDTYEHFGEVKFFIMNLDESYKKLLITKNYFLSNDDADFVAHYQFEMPPVILWEWMVDNNRRNLWMDGAIWSSGERTKGRTGSGSTNHCAHGKENSLEVILDWKPFDYYTYQNGNKIIQLVSTLKFIENEEGTKLYEFIKLKNKFPKFLAKFLVKLIAYKVMHIYECYKKIAELHKKSQTTINEKQSICC